MQTVTASMREALKPEELEEFAVRRQLEEFQEAVGEQALPASGVVSLKSSAADRPEAAAPKKVQKMYQRQGKKHGRDVRANGHQSSKKQKHTA